MGMWTVGSLRGFGTKRVRGRRRGLDEGDVLLKAGGMDGMRERARERDVGSVDGKGRNARAQIFCSLSYIIRMTEMLFHHSLFKPTNQPQPSPSSYRSLILIIAHGPRTRTIPYHTIIPTCFPSLPFRCLSN